MADAVDNDVYEAAVALWHSDQSGLPALFAEAPGAGRPKSPRERPLSLPYGTMTVIPQPGKTEFYTGTIRKDVRLLKIEAWGSKAQAVAALKAMLAVFNNQLGSGAAGQRTMVFPSGARFIKFWPTNSGELKQEEGPAAERQGVDLWKATVEGEVYSVRMDGQ